MSDTQQEIDRLTSLIRSCWKLAREVADPAAASRLQKLAEKYQSQLNRLLHDPIGRDGGT